jgi:hypothetical protein
MGQYIRRVAIGIVLLVWTLSSAGCAAAWFLAGIGTAATVIAASDDKETGSEPEENEK